MTLDKGVASLLRHPVHEHGGVVLLRPAQLGRGTVLEFVRSHLQSLLKIDLVNRVIVVTPTRVR